MRDIIASNSSASSTIGIRIKKKETCSNEEPTSTFVLSSHDRLSSSSAFFRVVVVHRGTWAGTKKWRQVCRKSLNRNLLLEGRNRKGLLLNSQ